jgi:short-subunit dehydrogenase
MNEALPWTSALVTGASSGIGEAIARDLARRGIDHLVLVARRADHLQRLAEDLHRGHGTEVEVLAADLADREGRTAVAARLTDDGRPVDLLVNNAGFGTSGSFATLDAAREEEEVLVNVVALQQLTRAALPGMLARGRGAVVNVASMATFVPLPSMATYGATKAFVTSFSEALHEETRGTGVTVSATLPGFTRTEFADQLGDESQESFPDFMWLSSDDVAVATIDGAIAGQALIVPGLGYRAAALAVWPLPRTLRRRAMGLVHSIRR